MENTKIVDTHQVTFFETSGGGQIFRIPVEVFPGFWGSVYLVLLDDSDFGFYRVLIDTGSGFGKANDHLEAGLASVSQQTGQRIGLDNLTHILITHGHIDHFGGLSYVFPRTQARLGIHELDRRILTNYEESLTVAAKRLREFLIEAGVAMDRLSGYMEMYTITKSLFHSVKVDFTFEAIGMRLGPFEMLHVPGHCAGQVVIRLHDVIFTGDHVLEHTSPHQSPEQITLSTGLEHYLQSLQKLKNWTTNKPLGLGGHEDPITDLNGRIEAIGKLHDQRLQKVLDVLCEPHTIVEVSYALFGEVSGYNVLLALEEAGAHVEYLYQRGMLGINNLFQVKSQVEGIPLYYFRLSDGDTGRK
jgi:glyoxylase-like metal-dependent hydrolase (beta-lactamase superfamily II)